jgi:hypothetical protein
MREPAFLSITLLWNQQGTSVNAPDVLGCFRQPRVGQRIEWKLKLPWLGGCWRKNESDRVVVRADVPDDRAPRAAVARGLSTSQAPNAQQQKTRQSTGSAHRFFSLAIDSHPRASCWEYRSLVASAARQQKLGAPTGCVPPVVRPSSSKKLRKYFSHRMS